MKAEKFIYNTQTLRYEKVEVSLQSKIFKWFGLLCALLVFSSVITFFALNIFSSPKEKLLQRELESVKEQYDVVNEQMDLQAEVLSNLQERDANVHRMIFGMEPIDKGIWEGGVGGSERYKSLKSYNNSGEMMVQTISRMDKLSRQMVMQSKSLDSILVMIEEKDKMLASLPSIKPVRADKLKKSMSQLSGYGMRVHPMYKVRKMHKGIDFSARTGTPIYASGDGVVKRVQSSRSGFGNNIILNHGYGYESLYAHMSKMLVKSGQKVKKGQKIGLVGSTGRSTGPHLHYEVHYKGQPINPIDYCQDGLKPQEYAQFVEQASNSNISFD